MSVEYITRQPFYVIYFNNLACEVKFCFNDWMAEAGTELKF